MKNNLISRSATLRNIFILLGIYILINIFLLPWAANKIDNHTGTGPIDLKFGYNKELVYSMIDTYSSEGIRFYKAFTITVDVVYPFFVLLLLTFSIYRLSEKLFPENKICKRFILFPVICFAADLIENIGILTVLSYYPVKLHLIINLMSIFTIIKWMSCFVSVAIIVTGLLILLFRFFKIRLATR